MSSEQDAVERLRRAIDIKSVDGQRDGVAGRYCLECDTFEVSPNEMRHKKTCPIPPMVDAVQALEASQQEVERLADVIDDLIIHSWDDGSTKRIPKVEWESAINREMDLLKETWERMTDAALEEQEAQGGT